MSFDLKGQRVLITAGASGIGRAVARAFAGAGARVHVCDIDPAALAVLAGEGIATSRTDVSVSAEVDAMFAEIERRFGGLDILVNNAGVSGPTKPVEEVTDEEWDLTMAVNVTGQFYCARRAAPLMKRQGRGAMINISSTAGRMGMPLRAPYSTSKYAVRGLTDVLAVELGEYGIRVNSILPGVIDGPRGERVVREQADARGIAVEDYLSALLHNVSLHCLIDAEEIAALALFLASDQARHISGQSIGVCGNFESYRSPLTIRPLDVAFRPAEGMSDKPAA